LTSLKPKVLNQAELKFPPNAAYIPNILDIAQGNLSVIIGTVFKEMRLKPCILKDLMGTLGQR
jgi:hypothetical protein